MLLLLLRIPHGLFFIADEFLDLLVDVLLLFRRQFGLGIVFATPQKAHI